MMAGQRETIVRSLRPVSPHTHEKTNRAILDIADAKKRNELKAAVFSSLTLSWHVPEKLVWRKETQTLVEIVPSAQAPQSLLLVDTEFCIVAGCTPSIFEICVRGYKDPMLLVSSKVAYPGFILDDHYNVAIFFGGEPSTAPI